MIWVYKMPPKKYLVVNADDFGQSLGVNRGIIEAHEKGIVTSASLMVRWPAAAEAALYARKHDLDLGLHIDLGEWRFDGNNWTPIYEVVPLDDPRAVALEINSQLATFRALAGRDPTHLDSHQHVHLRETVRPVVEEIANDFGIPARRLNPRICYCGEFYGQNADGSSLPDSISAEAMVRILRGLQPGITELCCHPGETDGLDTMYRAERTQEVRALCDPEVARVVHESGIHLSSFPQIAGYLQEAERCLE
jgi:predicted glycoside hydrolase/deacetylase ChbG (UPF0249 family)